MTDALANFGPLASGVYQSTPGLSDVATYMGVSFMPTYAMKGQFNSRNFTNTVLGAFGQYTSGQFDAQAAANLTTSYGVTAGSQAFKNMAGTAAFGYAMTGMSNPTAMQGLLQANMGGNSASNKLFNIGIQTYAGNKQRDWGAVMDDLWERWYGSKSAKIPQEKFEADLYGGFVGSNLQDLFGDNQAMYQMAVSYFYTKVKQGGKAGLKMSQMGGAGSAMGAAQQMGLAAENTPTIGAGRVNTARSAAIGASAVNGGMSGYNASASVISGFNSALADANTQLGLFTSLLGGFNAGKGFLQGVGGSEVGALATGVLSTVGSLASSFFAGGGSAVRGGGTSTSDSIPARLSHGEYVINARAASMIGTDRLNMLNNVGKTFGSGFASPVRFFDEGGTTLSNNPADISGSPNLGSFPTPGGSITVDRSVGALFQQLLADWQSDPALGGGRLDLTKGARIQSYNYRKARQADAISDHAGWAIDVRTDILTANNKQNMTSQERDAVHALLAKYPNIGWGGDYGKGSIDEMHFFHVGNGGWKPGSTGSGSSSPAGASAGGDDSSGTAGSSDTPSSTSNLAGPDNSKLYSANNKRLYSAASSGSSDVAGSGISSPSSPTSNITGKSLDIATGSSITKGKVTLKSVAVPAGEITKEQFARAILSGIGANTAGVPYTAMLSWINHEGGHWHNKAKHNPLNTTKAYPNSTSINSHGIKAYQTWQDGVNATLQTLAGLGGVYSGVVDSFISGTSADSIYQAITDSPWGTKNFDGIKKGGKTQKKSASVGLDTLARDTVVRAHAGEIIMPAEPAQEFRKQLQEFLSTNKGPKTPVNITLKIEKASDEEAERFAKKVIEIIDGRHHMHRLRTR